jgi:hypothetical protein
MVGLILKVFLIIAIILAGIVFALDRTGVATWGTVSVRTPDVAPCHRYAERFESDPVLTEVRWIWEPIEYGWGCHYEFGDDSKATITPMPR